jgi:VanZ family protein
MVRSPGPSAQEATLVQPLLSFETINVLKKGAHFVLFGVLAFLAFSSAMRRRPRGASASHSGAVFLNVAAALLLFAAGTEIVQFLTATRTPSLFDWAIDAGAILLGATIAL